MTIETSLTIICGFITAIASGVMVWAVFEAPKRAFLAQWKLQLEHEKRQRRMRIFSTLMATRGNALDPRHVESLNLIDVEFSEPSELPVREAWKAYLDHLNILEPSDTKDPEHEIKLVEFRKRHEVRRVDLLAELLDKMGDPLGYEFSFTYLKDRAYYPKGHGTVVEEEGALRRGLIALLWHGRPLMVRHSPLPEPIDDYKP